MKPTARGVFWIVLACLFGSVMGVRAANYRPAASRSHAGDELFTNNVGVRHLQIEIPAEGIEALRRFSFRSRQEVQRTNVAAVIREGDQKWTNVAVHIKGAFGSFQTIQQKPALTLNFDKWVDGQTFHGLKKISLNNSAQDPSYLSEKICREIYVAAGVPVPRADYATVELNGRYLGLFVLTEGWNKQFLRRHFSDDRGNFYYAGAAHDIHKPETAAFGRDPTNHAMLKAVTAAAQTTNHTRRIAALRETLDFDRFISMTALDCLMWNWDGYALNKNNYRMFHDRAANRLVLFPHGVDQMFWKANGPIMTGRSGLLAKSILETQEGRDIYLRRFREIRSNVFNVPQITNRIAEVAARLRPALLRGGVAALAQQDSAAQLFRSRLLMRVRDVDQQLAGVQSLVRLKKNESLPLTNWVARRQFGNVILDRTASPEGLHIQVKDETSFGAWVSTVWLEEGRYVLEGRAKTRGVQGALRNEPGGVGFRVWSNRKDTKGSSWSWFPYNSNRDPQLGGLLPVFTNTVEMRLTGDNEWQTITHDFELRNPLADLQIQCILQGTAGEAWFDPDSIRLRRKSLTVSRSAKD